MRSMVEGAGSRRRLNGRRDCCASSGARYAQPMRAPLPTIRVARKLRRDMTLPEVVLWSRLRQGRLDGLRFRRQHPIGPYVLDFYCADARLAVEVDGMAHDFSEQIRHDERRTERLSEARINVLRFAASDILKEETLEGVLLAILEAARNRAS